jgi:hypothetical protein
VRQDNLQFKAANDARAKSPRYVVAIVFDVGSIYVTSHDDIPSVPGTVLQGALKRPSAISQRVVPDEGRTEIGVFSFDLVDDASSFTNSIRAKLAAGVGLRGKTVRLYKGFRGFDFSAFQRFQTQIVSDCKYEAGVYSVTCEDISREQRIDIFEPKETTLTASCTATDTTINVASTDQFLSVTHGSAWSDGPSSTVYYFRIENEIIRASGKTTSTFTGCSRGQFNTIAAAHTVDTTTPQERRLKATEFIYLDLPAPKLALAVNAGVIVATGASPWPASLIGSQGGFETDSNADGVADGWSVQISGAGDGSRVQTASRPAGSAPFVGVCQRLAITSVTNTNDSVLSWSGTCRSGLTFTLSTYIRTNVAGKVILQLRFKNAAGAALLTTDSAFVAGDSIAHLTQVTATAPSATESVEVNCRGINAAGNFMELDQAVLEIGSTANAYTGAGVQSLLPEHWHMGIDPDFIRASDFVGIGPDLWDPTDDSKGFITRFEGLARQDGKRFVERELYLLLGSFSPIYSDGQLGLRRLPAMVSDAAPMVTLTERELVSIAPLQHDYSSLHNVIRVTWGFDLGIGDFTRDTLFIDAQSVSIHGKAPPIEYSFRGLHSGIHTEVMIRQRLNAIRDAYSYPPQRTSVVARDSLNCYETGDVMRVNVKNVRDFAGAAANIDRSFLCTQRSIDFLTGDVGFELFGSTLRPDAQGPSAEVTTPLPDAWYISAGVTLASVVGMTGNSVNVGTHNITGNSNLTNAGAIVYHNGDLVVPNGATINISANVQLRVKGFITLNGTINGVGTGLAGVADPGSGPITSALAGNPGFIGNARGYDGIDVRVLGITKAPTQVLRTIPPLMVRSKYEAWPELNLRESGGQLVGLPTDLRGTGGACGGRVVLTYSSGQITAGGTGGNGGAGLAIICRGVSFGVSALVNLSGANTSSPAKVSIGGFLPDVTPGAGGAGGPGAFLIVLDGNNLLFPNALGRYQGKTGTITQSGYPLPEREYTYASAYFHTVNVTQDPWAGYDDEQVISGQDLSVAALRVVYVPYTQTPAADQATLPSPVLGLTVTPGAGFNTVLVSLPSLNEFDVVDIYAAITNDRTGAVLVYRGRGADFQHNLPVLATRYYWAQTTRITELGLEKHSAFFPASSTAGVAGTTLNPGGWTPITTAGGAATMIATSSTIEKSGGSAAFDSQAYSSEKYPACSVSFRANDTTHELVLGLNSDPATNASNTSIDFAIHLAAAGTATMDESGSSVGSLSTYTAATQWLITYDGEAVRYYKDAVLQKSTLSPGLTLALDSSFFTPGGKVLDVKFQPMAMTSPANMFVTGGNCAYAGTTIQKVGGSTAWDSECRSSDGYSEGAFCSGRAGSTSFDLMFGLNSDPTTDQSYTSIDYAWYVKGASGAALEIYESNVSVGSFGTFTTSTILAVRHVGSLVQYIKDGAVVRSVPRTATTALYFDSSFDHAGATLLDVQFGPAGRGAEADPSAVFLETFEQNWETSFLNIQNGASLTVTYPNNGQFGGRVIRAAGDRFWIQSNENIPYDSTALYRITARIRRTAASGVGNEAVYVGVTGVAADGVTLINESGANSTGTQHYNCARNFDMSTVSVNTWKDHVGYFKGVGTSGFGVAPNNDSPTPLYTGVTFFRPLVILNYNGGNGSMECDFIKVERLVNPNDADNSDKNRIVPDAEFSRATDTTYWIGYVGGLSASAASGYSISASGGVDGGLLTLTGDSTSKTIWSRRRPSAFKYITSQRFAMTLRWRRTSSISAASGTDQVFGGFITGSFSDPTFSAPADVIGGPSIALTRDAVNAATINQWQETELLGGVGNHPKSSTQAPNLLVGIDMYAACTAGTIEVDACIVVLNQAPTSYVASAITRSYTDDASTSLTVGSGHAETTRRMTSASTVTITLPNSVPSGWSVGQAMHFVRGGTGAVNFTSAGTIRAKGGGSSITAQNGAVTVRLAASGVWDITGDI